MLLFENNPLDLSMFAITLSEKSSGETEMDPSKKNEATLYEKNSIETSQLELYCFEILIKLFRFGKQFKFTSTGMNGEF
jgi:hypothetical protein